MMATILSSPARKARTRRFTTSWPAQNQNVIRKNSARVRQPKRVVTAGSKTFRCATARTRCTLTGLAWRLHGLGHEPARLKIQRRRNRRLRQGTVEDRERRVQRDEKSRLRTRTQFWPRQKIPGDDPGRAKPARLRLAFCPRSRRTALEGRTRGGCEANRIFRRPPDPDELCRLSLLAGLLRIHHHLHHSTGTAQNSENRIILGKRHTFRIAADEWEAAYVRRIDATVAALRSAGVPVFWVGLPAQRNTRASSDSSYLNELYRQA